MSTIDRTIITQSKTLNLSFKYKIGPKAINFKSISNKNIEKNTVFIISNAFNS